MIVKFIGKGETNVWDITVGNKVTVKTGELFKCKDSVGKTYVKNKTQFAEATSIEADEFEKTLAERREKELAKNEKERENIKIAVESCTDVVNVSYSDWKFFVSAFWIEAVETTKGKLSKTIEEVTKAVEAKIEESDENYVPVNVGLTEEEKEALANE